MSGQVRVSDEMKSWDVTYLSAPWHITAMLCVLE